MEGSGRDSMEKGRAGAIAGEPAGKNESSPH